MDVYGPPKVYMHWVPRVVQAYMRYIPVMTNLSHWNSGRRTAAAH